MKPQAKVARWASMQAKTGQMKMEAMAPPPKAMPVTAPDDWAPMAAPVVPVEAKAAPKNIRIAAKARPSTIAQKPPTDAISNKPLAVPRQRDAMGEVELSEEEDFQGEAAALLRAPSHDTAPRTYDRPAARQQSAPSGRAEKKIAATDHLSASTCSGPVGSADGSGKQESDDDCIIVQISTKAQPKARPKAILKRKFRICRVSLGSKRTARQMTHGANRSNATDGICRDAPWRCNASASSHDQAAGLQAVRKLRRRVTLLPAKRVANLRWTPMLRDIARRMQDPARYPRMREMTRHLEVVLEAKELLFTHDSVSPTFQHGRHKGQSILSLASTRGLQDAGAQAYRGGILLSRLPPLVVVQHDRTYHVVCGNRRLKGILEIKRRERQQVFVSCVRYRSCDKSGMPASVLARWLLASTSQNAGMDAETR
eukprot:TRINITY_DN48099_c0_g1_i1.p1 TRINITY_DN48099_c0_g1~~TRINITY_DN48099_c0_g1_i1.p1  ORF type:complete len:427 (-),score=62.20 TRINITY_DN48099_c0_g1_i1:211-1491(-)